MPTRDAASSIPRGRPSSRWQISATAAVSSIEQREPGLHATGPFDEQAHRFALERVVGPVRQVRHAERRDGILLLDRESERRPARDQHVQSGRRLEQLADPRRRVDDLLEVVEHEQRLAIGQVAGEAVERCRPRRFHEREARRDRRDDQLRIADRVEGDEPRAILELAGHPSRELDRQPRLARAAGTGQRDQALLAARARQARPAPTRAR